MKILTKTPVIYLKRKLRTCRIQIQIEKVWFIAKKIEKKNFQIFFFKGGTLWCRNDRKNFLRFFKFSKIFFEKWPQWDITNVERNKVMKFELHRTVHWGVTRDIPPGGVRWTPTPCRIGLKASLYLNKYSNFNPASWKLDKIFLHTVSDV